MVLPDRRRPARRDARGGRAARAPAAPAALGARVPPVDAPLPRHRGALRAAPDHPREAHPLRRPDLPLDLRRRAGLEPRGGAPRVPARAVAGPRGGARGGAAAALRDHHPRVPGAPREVAALRRGRGARLPPGGGLRAGERSRAAERELPRGAAIPRLLQSGGAALVVGGPPGPGPARRGGLVARRRRGAAGHRPAPGRRRPPAPQPLRPAPPPGVRRGGSGGPTRPAGLPALPVGRGRDAALRGDVLVGRHQQRLRDPGGADPARPEHGAVRGAVLGHRRGRLLPSDPRDRGAVRALVPARGLQPDLPLARLGLAGARAMGPRRRGRGHLPPLRGAPLPAAPLHVHAGLAGAHARASR